MSLSSRTAMVSMEETFIYRATPSKSPTEGPSVLTAKQSQSSPSAPGHLPVQSSHTPASRRNAKEGGIPSTCTHIH